MAAVIPVTHLLQLSISYHSDDAIIAGSLETQKLSALSKLTSLDLSRQTILMLLTPRCQIIMEIFLPHVDACISGKIKLCNHRIGTIQLRFWQHNL